jgi:CHRD domain
VKCYTILAALMLGAAFAAPLSAISPKVTLTAVLAGSNEPAGGDADGTGSFSAMVDADNGDFCYALKADKIAAATMAHVHSGAAGANGPPVATIALTDDNCMAIEPDVLRAMVAHPENYYVNIHNAEFPAGAIRGQLQLK